MRRSLTRSQLKKEIRLLEKEIAWLRSPEGLTMLRDDKAISSVMSVNEYAILMILDHLQSIGFNPVKALANVSIMKKMEANPHGQIRSDFESIGVGTDAWFKADREISHETTELK